MAHAVLLQHDLRQTSSIDFQSRIWIWITLMFQQVAEEQHQQCKTYDPGCDQHCLAEQRR
jgi:hypothetical protein